MKIGNERLKWLIFIGLSFVWGSSFILMKLAMLHLSPTQVGAFRMIIAGIFLLLLFYKRLFHISKRHWKYLFFISISGTFIPVFLFTFAIQHIDSGVVAILNSFTPLNTLIVGYFFFQYLFTRRQLTGIFIGIVGTIMLVYQSADVNPGDNYWYALLVLVATLGYAINVNVIKKHLADLDAISIATGNFAWVLLPSMLVLYLTGFFEMDYMQEPVLIAIGYVGLLAIFGTAVAMIYFNKMVHIASPLFASSVTYTIPLIAVLWGIWDDEKISLLQILAGGIILLGVYIVNSKGSS